MQFCKATTPIYCELFENEEGRRTKFLAKSYIRQSHVYFKS